MTSSQTFRTETTEEMRVLGTFIAQKVLDLGKVSILLLLEGALGAGKTTFSQGFFKALGVQEEVTSPSYGILHAYETQEGRLLYHMDMYRIDSEEDFEELEVEEILSSRESFVFVVEWASKFSEVWENLPSVRILHLSFSLEYQGRSLLVEGL